MSTVSLNTLLYIARSGLLSQQLGIDSVANNVANVNTTGYKRQRAEFEEILSNSMQTPPEGSSRLAGRAGGALFDANQRIFEQGRVQATNQPWDMAIEGEGFFQIQLPNGSTAYTRDGNFRLDGEGSLTTLSGYYLQPPVTIPPDAEESMISANGEVMVRRRGEIEPQTIATITLARFADPAGLENNGDNLFIATEASGAAQVSNPQENGTGQIISRALEDSNADLSREMVDLISAQKAYTLMTRAFKTTDDMLSMVNQMRA